MNSHMQRILCTRYANDQQGIHRHQTPPWCRNAASVIRGPLRPNVTSSIKTKLHDVGPIATPPEDDRATATGNLHKKFVKIGPAVRGQTHRQTDRQTNWSQYSVALPERSNNLGNSAEQRRRPLLHRPIVVIEIESSIGLLCQSKPARSKRAALPSIPCQAAFGASHKHPPLASCSWFWMRRAGTWSLLRRMTFHT